MSVQSLEGMSNHDCHQRKRGIQHFFHLLSKLRTMVRARGWQKWKRHNAASNHFRNQRTLTQHKSAENQKIAIDRIVLHYGPIPTKRTKDNSSNADPMRIRSNPMQTCLNILLFNIEKECATTSRGGTKDEISRLPKPRQRWRKLITTTKRIKWTPHQLFLGIISTNQKQFHRYLKKWTAG